MNCWAQRGKNRWKLEGVEVDNSGGVIFLDVGKKKKLWIYMTRQHPGKGGYARGGRIGGKGTRIVGRRRMQKQG